MRNLKKVKAYTVALCILAIGTTSCGDECVSGSGPAITEELELSTFTGVRLKGSFDLTINQAAEQSVMVTGNPNIIELLNKDVRSGVWEIELESGCYNSFQLEVEVNMPIVDLIELEGSGDISITSFDELIELSVFSNGSGDILHQGSFEVGSDVNVQTTGSGDMILSVNSPALVSSQTGSGDMTVRGQVVDHNISLTGSGNYSGFGMMCDSAIVNSTGSGNVEVQVDSFLSVVLLGSGNISYRGMPNIQSQIAGSGELIDAN